MSERRPDALAERLLAWYDREGRHALPWQSPRDAYRVWVSEIMLQQTQVTTVIPYFERFMARFPDVAALAAAEQDEVLHLWTGLGYYARARNLHRAARRVVEDHGGALPADPQTLRELPGIGPSTAGAIAAMAYDRRAPILDGNVKRVLARFHGIRGWPGEREVERRLWTLAEAHTPHERVADYTQAVMDLGATVCTRGAPACERCPLAGECVARARGLAEEIPAPRPKRELPERATRVLLLTDADGRLLLARRPAEGVWGGMWSFPELAPDARPIDGARALLDAPAPPLVERGTWPPLRHGFTHFRLTMTPVELRTDARRPPTATERPRSVAGVADAPDEDEPRPPLRWIDPRRPPDIALAAPVRRLLAGLAGGDEALGGPGAAG